MTPWPKPAPDSAEQPSAEEVLTAQILDTLGEGLLMMALRRLGDLDLAEEVVQETLARLVQAVKQGRLTSSQKVGAFAAGIARHVITDEYRKREREGGVTAISMDALAHEVPDALSSLVSNAEAERVRAALDTLSRSDRKLLRLCFFDGLGAAEVARRLGAPADRIRKRKSRALERLRNAFLSKPQAGHGIDSPPTKSGGGDECDE